MAAVIQSLRITWSQAPTHLQIYSPSPLTLFQLKGKFSAKAQQGCLTLSIGHRKEISAGSTAAGWFVASAPPVLACSGLSGHSANSDWKEEGKELSQSKSSQQGKESRFLKPSALSSTQSSTQQLRRESTVSVVEDVSISKLKTILGACFSQ